YRSSSASTHTVELPPCPSYPLRPVRPPPLHPSPTRRSSDLSLVAAGIAFDTHELTVPADAPFTIALDNQDPPSVHHDVDIHDAKDRKSTRLNSSHVKISYAVLCLKKKKKTSQPARNTPSHIG